MIETPNGEVKVKKSIIEDYKECLNNRDLAGLKELHLIILLPMNIRYLIIWPIHFLSG